MVFCKITPKRRSHQGLLAIAALQQLAHFVDSHKHRFDGLSRIEMLVADLLHSGGEEAVAEIVL